MKISRFREGKERKTQFTEGGNDDTEIQDFSPLLSQEMPRFCLSPYFLLKDGGKKELENSKALMHPYLKPSVK